MGPITIFDKSALEALNPDEATWLDNFYLTNITPLFFAETLADLEKETAAGRSPEQVVGSIAYRTPAMHSSPNCNHLDLVISNLLGQEVPMDGRIPRAGGSYVSIDGRSGVVYEEAPEMRAMQRWQEGRFLEVERDFAKGWREQLRVMDLDQDAKIFAKVWSRSTRPKTLADAKSNSAEMVAGIGKEYGVLRMALEWFDVPKHLWPQIGERWYRMGKLGLLEFAPYAAHVLSVDFFFFLAISAGLVSAKRSSNRIDIAYLYYLPFCMIFVSSDKLHRKTVPVFLRENQTFVWGQDLKEDLGRLDTHFSMLPPEIRELGIIRFASRPPLEGVFLTANLWDRFLTLKWREGSDEERMKPPKQNPSIAQDIKRFTETKSSSELPNDIDLIDIDTLTIERRVPLQRGKWRILPPGIENRGPEG